MSKLEKYILITFSILLVILLAISFGNESKVTLTSNEDKIFANAKKESKAVKNKRPFIHIDLNEYFEKYKSSDEHLILISKPSCKYCEIAEPILQDISSRYGLDIYYLDVSEFIEGDEKKLTDSDKAFEGGLGTPMLLTMGNGKIYDYVEGLTDTAHYESFLKINGYI